MKKKTSVCLIVCFSIFFASLLPLLPAFGEPSPSGDGGPAFKAAGSVLGESGYIGFRSGIPDGETRDWYSLTSASLRLSRDGGTERFFASLWTQHDTASSAWELSLDEAWFEIRPFEYFSARTGRFPVRYGPCLAFNPANSLLGKDSFDSRAGRVGLDGIELALQPLSGTVVLNAALLLPGGSGPQDISEAGSHGRLTVFVPGAGILGPTELGLSGDFRRLGGTAPEGQIPAAGGAWLSADIGGFVLGAEGTLRTADFAFLSVPGVTELPPLPAGGDEAEAACAFSVNRKAGDYFAVAESFYSTTGDLWLGFARISKSGEKSDISVSALFDFGTGAARTAVDATWNASDFIEFGAKAAWNYRGEKWASPLQAEWTAGISAECFY